MADRSVTHASFTIERTYHHSPAKVFEAFADPAVKARWFGGPQDWASEERELDFRVGGREVNRSGPEGGAVHSYQAHYWDIVPSERIVYAYDMHIGEARISVSLATIELTPTESGTRLLLTEQGAFLDGYDDAGSREHGTRLLLDALGAALDRAEER